LLKNTPAKTAEGTRHYREKKKTVNRYFEFWRANNLSGFAGYDLSGKIRASDLKAVA
jgi:hypothetical protein